MSAPTRVGLGKIALTKTPICFSQDSQALLDDKSIVNPHYALYFLSQAVQIFRHENRGTTISGVTKKQLSELTFFLPPFNEQHRIVSKIESIFAQIDAAKKFLIKVECLCMQFKQSILKNAFNGELTREWRYQNKSNIETEKQQLKQIYQELKIMTKNQFKIFGTLHKNNLYKIPGDWIWARLINIAQIGQGGTPPTQNQEFWNGNIPWLRSGEIRNNFIEKADNFITKKGLQGSPTTLCPSGTVLLAMTGQGLTRGRCAILKLNACANQSVAHMILDSRRIINKFLFYYLQSQYWQMRGISKGSNQPGLNVSLIKQFEIPIPTLSEQKYIVITLESIFAEIDVIEQYVKSTLQLLDQLKNSTLKQAFEGKLVPQDPSDEPAEFVLPKIKQENSLPHNSPDVSP